MTAGPSTPRCCSGARLTGALSGEVLKDPHNLQGELDRVHVYIYMRCYMLYIIYYIL